VYMHLYFARNRQLRIKQNTKQIPQQHNTDSNILIHIAIDMMDTDTALYQWQRIYTQKNVYWHNNIDHFFWT